MQTWAIIAQKGGQSKTTIATAFAVEAACEGAPAFAPNTAAQRRHQWSTENLEIHDSRQSLQRIACRAQRLVPV